MKMDELIVDEKYYFHNEEVKYLSNNGFFVYCIDDENKSILTTPDKLRREKNVAPQKSISRS